MSTLDLTQFRDLSIKSYDWGVMVDNALIYHNGDPVNFIKETICAIPRTSPIVAFADGSGTTGNKTAGIGCVIYEKGSHPIYIAEFIGLGTNNVAELSAIQRILKQIPDRLRKIIIYTDSEYARGSLDISLGWSPQANVKLIQDIREELSLRPNIQIHHVDGHSGVMGNEICDILANMGRKLVR